MKKFWRISLQDAAKIVNLLDKDQNSLITLEGNFYSILYPLLFEIELKN